MVSYDDDSNKVNKMKDSKLDGNIRISDYGIRGNKMTSLSVSVLYVVPLIVFTPDCLAACTFADCINTTLCISIRAHSPCSPAFGCPAQDHLRSLDCSRKIRRSHNPRLGA